MGPKHPDAKRYAYRPSDLGCLTENNLVPPMQSIKIAHSNDCASILRREIMIILECFHSKAPSAYRALLNKDACIAAAYFFAVYFAVTAHFNLTRTRVDFCYFGHRNNFIADKGGLTKAQIQLDK